LLLINSSKWFGASLAERVGTNISVGVAVGTNVSVGVAVAIDEDIEDGMKVFVADGEGVPVDTIPLAGAQLAHKNVIIKRRINDLLRFFISFSFLYYLKD
jgi:hypothetical protein